jgi:hypothetical protein
VSGTAPCWQRSSNRGRQSCCNRGRGSRQVVCVAFQQHGQVAVRPARGVAPISLSALRCHCRPGLLTALSFCSCLSLTTAPVNCVHSGNCVAVQIQHYGGTQSRFKTNDPDRKTSYSWRDTTVVMTMDAFYPPNSDSQAVSCLWWLVHSAAQWL